MNPYDDADDDFQDYERRQRQIEEDKVLAERMQQELNQQQRLFNNQESQDRLTQTDEELAVCLLANYLHEQDGSTSQSEPQQTFSRGACSSTYVTGRAELDGVIPHGLLDSVHPQQHVHDDVSNQQALDEAMSLLSLSTTQQHVHDYVSSQQALDEAMALLSLSTTQQHVHNGGRDQQALDEAIALSLSTAQTSGQTRGNNLAEDEYEYLLELDEDLIGSSVQAMSLNQLQLLPTHKYEERPQKTSGAVDERKEQCAICLDMYESGFDVKLLPCLHKFHAKCIDKWLQRKAVCPTCKIQVEV